MKKRILASLLTTLALYIPFHADAAPMKCVAVQVNEGDTPLSVQTLKAILPKGGCVRDVLGWHKVEPVIGQHVMPSDQWQSYQNVATAGDYNLVTLAFGNKLYGSNGYDKKINNFSLPVTPAQVEAFKKYAVWVVSNDGGSQPDAAAANIPNLYAVSVWNELNGSWNGGIKNIRTRIALYGALLNVVGPAIRQANPNVKVIIGATVGSNIDGWFTRLFAGDTWGKNDPNVYLDVHPYIGKGLSKANQSVPQLATWKRSMTHIRNAGINNALFATEWGGKLGKVVETANPSLNFFDWTQRNVFASEKFAGTAWFEATNFGNFGDAGLVSDSSSVQTTKLGSEFINW